MERAGFPSGDQAVIAGLVVEVPSIQPLAALLGPSVLGEAKPGLGATREGEVGELMAGDCFGQEALLFNMRQEWDARALTYSRAQARTCTRYAQSPWVCLRSLSLPHTHCVRARCVRRRRT